MDEADRRAGGKHRDHADRERKMAIIAAGARSSAATFRLCDPASTSVIRCRSGSRARRIRSVPPACALPCVVLRRRMASRCGPGKPSFLRRGP